MLSNFTHPSKAFSPIVVIVLGSEIDCKLTLSLNALEVIDSTLIPFISSGMIALIISLLQSAIITEDRPGRVQYLIPSTSIKSSTCSSAETTKFEHDSPIKHIIPVVNATNILFFFIKTNSLYIIKYNK